MGIPISLEAEQIFPPKTVIFWGSVGTNGKMKMFSIYALTDRSGIRQENF